MLLLKNLKANPLFADERSEVEFRQALEKAVQENETTSKSLRVVSMSDRSPESVGVALASLITGTPLLLACDEWSTATLAVLSDLRKSKWKQGSVLIKTGGSSGKVRFAVHNWQSLQAAASNIWSHLGRVQLSAQLNLPLFHVSGWMPVVRALFSGGLVRSGENRGLSQLPGLQLASVVPTTLYRALQNPEEYPSLFEAHRIFAGGAAFAPELLEKARSLKMPISLVYGMTETAGMIAIQDPRSFLEGEGQWARALDGNEIGIGKSGEIKIQSPQLFKGYAGEEQTVEDSWNSGDIGSLDEEGRLQVFGRAGRVITSGGETISLDRVESAARELDGVLDCHAVGEEDDEWGTQIILYLVSSKSETVDWRKELRSLLEPWEIPAKVELRNEIPRNSAGKVDFERLFG